MQVIDIKARLDACAQEFSPEAVKSAHAYLDAALPHEAKGERSLQRAMIVLAGLSLGGDVWQPKTAGEQLRHDLRTYADKLAGLSYSNKQRRRKA